MTFARAKGKGADGHFSKNQLIISCLPGTGSNDADHFKRLLILLGYGSLKPYSRSSEGGRALRFVISSNAGLKHVLNLINGKFVGVNKYNQLLKHDYASKLHILLLPPRNGRLL